MFRLAFKLAILVIATALPGLFNAVAAEVVDLEPERALAVIAESPELVIIDLRTPPEFNEGHVPGAININAVAPNLGRLLTNDERLRGRDWLVYCRNGHRSQEALPAMQRVARGTIYFLVGGVAAWTRAGHALAK